MKTFSRISIYQQEVFWAYVEEGQICFRWLLAKSPLERAFGPALSRMRPNFPSVELVDLTYEPGGQDQIALWTRGADAALGLMRDPDVARSVRLFNLRLAKKGPCMFSRYHCFDLADRFYDQETDSLLSQAHSLFDRH